MAAFPLYSRYFYEIDNRAGKRIFTFDIGYKERDREREKEKEIPFCGVSLYVLRMNLKVIFTILVIHRARDLKGSVFLTGRHDHRSYISVSYSIQTVHYMLCYAHNGLYAEKRSIKTQRYVLYLRFMQIKIIYSIRARYVNAARDTKEKKRREQGAIKYSRHSLDEILIRQTFVIHRKVYQKSNAVV